MITSASSRVPGGEQELHDVVQQRRVTADVLVHGEESIQLRTAEGRGVVHQCLPGADRVAIACQSVDLAVVGNASERVGTVPRWEGVRRETRVHDCQEGCALLRLEVLSSPAQGTIGLVHIAICKAT